MEEYPVKCDEKTLGLLWQLIDGYDAWRDAHPEEDTLGNQILSQRIRELLPPLE